MTLNYRKFVDTAIFVGAFSLAKILLHLYSSGSARQLSPIILVKMINSEDVTFIGIASPIYLFHFPSSIGRRNSNVRFMCKS